MQVASEQLDVTIQFALFLLIKDMEISLLKLRQSLLTAKQEYEKIKAHHDKAEGKKYTESAQTTNREKFLLEYLIKQPCHQAFL